MREQEVRNLWEAYLEVCENQQLDEVSDAKVAAVRKARQKNVNKSFDKLDDSRGSSQNLATAISKLQKNQRLSAKRDTRNEEVEELDEVSGELVDRAVNKRIAATGAAYDAEMRDRTPENMRASVRAGKKEASMKTAAAKRRKRINNEEVENWVNSLIEEGYDLSDYTWEEMYEMYVTESDSIAAMRERAAKRRKQRYGASDTSRGGRDDFAPITDYEAANKKWARPTQKEEVDIFDVILDHLVAEGYADTNESAIAIMANMSEEWREDIMEISQKTATSAYAKSATGEFEGADSERDIKRTENLGKHIERKFGKKALEDADRHADSSTFGRKDPRTGKRQPRPQSRFQNPNKYRTRADGKMHGQDQNKLKAKLERRRGED